MCMKSAFFIFLAFFLLMLLPVSCNQGKIEEHQKEEEVVPLSNHWEKPVPYQEVPEGLTSLSAESCGSCHRDHYEEWKTSTHAVAWQDPQFQKELQKENIFACLNCHIPLENQQEFLVEGKIEGDYKRPVRVKNPRYDAKLMDESITCAVCHVRDGAVIGSLGTGKAPHKTVKDPEFLSETLCMSCHNVAEVLNPTLVCTFETGDEWKGNWAQKEGKNCISCHMPNTEREWFPGMPKRKSHFHNFPGSGIPKLMGMEVKGLNGLSIREDHLRSSIRMGEKFDYTIYLKNEHAGHRLPTGDPERFFLISIQLVSSDGKVIHEENGRIGEKWQWYPKAEKLDDNNLDPKEERQFDFSYIVKQPGLYKLKVKVSKHRMTEETARYHGLFGQYPLSIEVFSKSHAIQVK